MGMKRTVTPQLVGAVAVTALALVLALFFGRVELLAAATPLLLAVVVGVFTTNPPAVTVQLTAEPGRLVEGEKVTLTLVLESDEGCRDVEIGVRLPPALKVAEGDLHRREVLLPGVPLRTELLLVATHWGVCDAGTVALRARGWGGWIVFEGVYHSGVAVRVYPAPQRVRSTLAPPDTQVFTGNYVARSAGDGIEFSGVRPYTRGDSVRRVNWRVTSRRGSLHVNEFHPERNSEVVLFLDTFSDVGPPGDGSLDRGVRGASSLARSYLEHRDRVGLVGFGGTLSWLTSGMGNSQTFRIVEYMLELEATLSYAWKDITTLPPGTLPPYAFVVAFSPLVDKRALQALTDLHARRHSLVIIDTLWEDQTPELKGAEEVLARRVWKLERASVRYQMGAAGIPVVQWTRTGDLEAALATAQSYRRRPRVRRP